MDGGVQARGVGTLLLEHLASVGRHRGLRRFVAEVLAENRLMIKVFADAGLAYRSSAGGPERHVEIALDPDETYLDAMAERERVADVASLAALPGSGSNPANPPTRSCDAYGPDHRP